MNNSAILKLDELMNEKGLTNAQLVRATEMILPKGISSANISHYRRGLSQPNTEKLAILAIALNVAPTDLINFKAIGK